MVRHVARLMVAGVIAASCAGSSADTANSDTANTGTGAESIRSGSTADTEVAVDTTAPTTQSDPGETTVSAEAEPAESADTGSLAAFCAQFVTLQGEVAEDYVGSAEHLADIDELLAVSPSVISADAAVFRDYLASGAIDSVGDPDSNLVENWPDDVVAAVGAAQSYGNENC